VANAEGDRSEYAPPDRLRELPSWLVSQVALHAGRLVGAALAEDGMRRQHFTVMTALAEQGAASQAALGRRLWIDRSDLHTVLAELERDGLVARVRDEHDRRRNLVELTAAGTAVLRRLDARVEAAQVELLKPLPAADRRDLRRMLTRLAEHHSRRGG
jgi:DNA-binding MarR family transcriptional regulator